MNLTSQNSTLKKSDSWRMFNEISVRYDILNHILSFGLHTHWRKLLGKYLRPKQNQAVLDVATGTADVLISLTKRNKDIQQGVGIDMAEKMLAVGRDKVKKYGLDNRIILKTADANQIPFEDNSFDCSTIAFGIRNMENPQVVLREMYRVLNKEGRALILEFSLPDNKLMNILHLFYLRTVVPLIGGMISGHSQAYHYLNQTIETFPYGKEFCSLMTSQGFSNVRAHPLIFGIATIYQGDKI